MYICRTNGLGQEAKRVPQKWGALRTYLGFHAVDSPYSCVLLLGRRCLHPRTFADAS